MSSAFYNQFSPSSATNRLNFGRTLRMWRKLSKCWTGIFVVGLLTILTSAVHYNARTITFVYRELPSNPSEPQDLKTLEQQLTDGTASNNTKLRLIADFIHRRLNYLQTNASCASTIFCGHDDYCGLGCQLHHRSLCVFTSFLLNMPLVHNKANWPYYDKWETVFQPLGSRCSGAESGVQYRIQWNQRPICPFIETKNSSDWFFKPVTLSKDGSTITLTQGLQMPPEIRETLNKIHPSPFVWLIGLFANYTMKLQPEFENEYSKWKSSLHTTNLIGSHVRRTDKRFEAEDSVHDVSEYAKAALRIHQKIPNATKPVMVYVATDDSKVLKEFQTRYTEPDWRVIGQDNDTSLDLKARNSGLKTVVRDILTLTDTDFLICGLSSNLCRLVFELKTYRGNWNPATQFKSMDRKHDYHYATLCSEIPPKIV